MKRIILIITILILATSLGWSQQRYALLVGISDYPAESGWNKLHAYNDIEFVSKALLKLNDGFFISELKDSRATHNGITNAMRALAGRVHQGDQCIILFSCHGQQITDLNQDEFARDNRDWYDEAIVPYDAMISYDWHHSEYKGENHLRDDEINRLLHDIKQAIGPKGQLIVVYDACHSGDMSRAKQDEEESSPSPRRGTANAFRIPDGKVTRKADSSWPIEWISISACNSEHNNYEVMIDGLWYGRLAYSFSQVIRSGITGDELVKALKEQYKLLPTDANRPVQVLDYYIPLGMKDTPLLK